MRKLSSPPQDVGDPEKTPFVRFDHGTLYPSNDIYQAAETVLVGLRDSTAPELFKVLIRRGLVGGQYGILRDSTWFAILNRFLNYHSAAEDSPTAKAHCIEALRLMVRRPHEDAWLALREYVLARIDDLSGWSTSFKRQIAEEQNVFRGEDGNYYYRDHTYGIVQIVGAKTTEETRIDFITNQLVSSTGFLHQFIGLFSLFAIADDFDRNPNHYHRLIKAVLPGSKFSPVGYDWTLLHFDGSRTYRWRPHSNLCDPGWLVGDILGSITDTLDIDYWQRHISLSALDQAWLEDGHKFQMDYVLDTTLTIGTEPYAYITFEGKVMRWINGTPERDATVSISVANLHHHAVEDEQLNRFLSLLVWEHGQSARIKWGIGGGRTAYSKAYSPRRAGGLRVEAGYLQRGSPLAMTTDQKLALGLYREAQNSSSTFYEFLCYYRILELAVPNKGNKAREQWLNTVAIKKLGYLDRMKEILAQHQSLEKYLREVQANGIKHTIKKTHDPDSPRDQLSTTKDNELMGEIAKLVMRDQLGL
jgi:hypothetical protein